MSQQAEADDRFRKEFIDERNKFETAESEAAKSFDQAMLTLSTGALGFSLFFVDRIAKDPLGFTLWLFLIPAWILFCLSIVCTLASFLSSQFSCRAGRVSVDQVHVPVHAEVVNQIRHADLWIQMGEHMPTWLGGPGRSWGECVDRLNVAAVITFVCGVVCLGCFSGVNILSKSEVTMSANETKGVKPNPDGQRGYRGPTPAPPPPKNEPRPSQQTSK